MTMRKFKFGPLTIDAQAYGSQGNAILGIRDSGKALALDTPLPTPTGWTTMGDVRVGDHLFDERGQPCRVLETKEVLYGRECFIVKFSDGSEIVADGDHLWLTESYKSRTADRNVAKKNKGKGRRSQRKTFPSLVTTRHIRDTIFATSPGYQEHNHAVKNCGVMECQPIAAPISPYVLGCWLGDGTSQSAIITTADNEILENIRSEGYEIGKAFCQSKSGKAACYRIQLCPDGNKLHTKLREQKLILNKHVPPIYLRGSRDQRLALLSGLMDTDGTVHKGSNSCVFYNMNEGLALAVHELVCSMGWSATIRTKRAKLNGRDYGECFEIRFRPTEQIFRLKRKADILDFTAQQSIRRTRKTIMSVEQTESVPVRCIRVSSDSHLFLCGRSMIPTHNTYTATEMAEKLFEAGVPFITFDPTGVWRWLQVPGAGRGYPVVVAGGKHGNLPLTVNGAVEIVRAAMKNGVSLVLDLTDPNLSKANWKQIVKSCVRVLLQENATHGLRHIFIEEAAEFVPQRVIDGDVYAEVEKLARIGGNAWLGYTLINQRSQEVNKAVLELCENLFLHRQKGKNAIENIDSWFEIAGVEQAEIIKSLPNLPSGQCWAWMGGDHAPTLVKVPPKNSFHPDRRTMHGVKGKRGKKAVDVGGFIASMKTALVALEAEAAANDPAKLRAEIAALKAAAKKSTVDPAAITKADKAGFERGVKATMAEANKTAKSIIAGARAAIKKSINELLGTIESELGRSDIVGKITAPIHRPVVVSAPAITTTKTVPIIRQTGTQQQHGTAKETTLGAGERAILIATAQSVDGIASRQQLTIVTGYKKSTRNAYVQRLAAAGLVTANANGENVFITELGKQALGDDYEPLPTGTALLAYHLAKLPQGEREVLQVIVDGTTNRDAITDATGYKKSTRNAYIQRLAARQLVEANGDTVTASPLLSD